MFDKSVGNLFGNFTEVDGTNAVDTPDCAPLRRAVELVEQKRTVLVEQKRNVQDKGSNLTLSPQTRNVLIHRAIRGDPNERNNVLMEQELMKSSKERIDNYFKSKAEMDCKPMRALVSRHHQSHDRINMWSDCGVHTNAGT